MAEILYCISEKGPILEGEIEMDEVYVVAGHKGNPDAVKKRNAMGGEEDSRGLEEEGR